MSEREITPEFLAREFDMLREHVLDLKRACFDRFGETREGYEAHVTCSNIEPLLARASAQIAKVQVKS